MGTAHFTFFTFLCYNKLIYYVKTLQLNSNAP